MNIHFLLNLQTLYNNIDHLLQFVVFTDKSVYRHLVAAEVFDVNQNSFCLSWQSEFLVVTLSYLYIN